MKNVSGNKKLVLPNCIGQDRGLGATKVATATRMDDLALRSSRWICILSLIKINLWCLENGGVGTKAEVFTVRILCDCRVTTRVVPASREMGFAFLGRRASSS